MPKEKFEIATFTGMTPADGGKTGLINLKGARVDTGEGILIPEYEDDIIAASRPDEPGSLADIIVNKKLLYVNGVEKVLLVYGDGSITIDGVVVGSTDVTDTSVETIGRQAIMSQGRNLPAKFIRDGYTGDAHINFNNNEVIVEDDVINSTNIDIGNVHDYLIINPKHFLVLNTNATRFRVVTVDGDEYATDALCEEPIIAFAAWTEDTIDTGAHYRPIKNVYYAYKSNGTLNIRFFDFNTLAYAGKSYLHTSIDIDGIKAIGIDDTNPSITIDSSNIPDGFELESMVCTSTKLFLAFTKKIANGEVVSAGYASTQTLVPTEKDIFFAIYLDNAKWTTGGVVVAGDDLFMSKCPFNPYRFVDSLSVTTGHANDGTVIGDAIISSNRLRTIMALPYELFEADEDIDTSLVTGSNEGDKLYQAYGVFPFHLSTINYADIGTINEIEASDNGLVTYIPGGCGALCSAVHLTGKLVVVSYADDIVGYVVKHADDTAHRKATPNSVPYDAQSIVSGGVAGEVDKNCLGFLVTTAKRVSANVVNVTTRSSWVSPPNVSLDYLALGTAADYAFYCWNGVEPVDADCLAFDTGFGYPISIIKHFDDENSRGAETHRSWTRFVLYPKIAIGDAEWRSSTVNITPSVATEQAIFHTNSDTIAFATLNNPTTPWAAIPVTNVSGAYYSSNILHKYINAYMPDGYVQGGCNARVLESAIADNTFLLSKNNLTTIEARNLVMTVPHQYADINIGAVVDSVTLDAGLLTLGDDEVTEHPGGISDDYVAYKVSFVYDGVSISPLTQSRLNVNCTANLTNKVALKISLSPQDMLLLSKRVTAINIYSAPLDGGLTGTESEYYRLVERVELTNYNFANYGGTYVYNTVDYGARLASFVAETGYSETLRTVSATRGCQCVCGNSLFIGDVSVIGDIDNEINTNNLLLRSQPFQPSVFNYLEDFIVLSFTPIALTSFNGRVYAWGTDRYSIINPDSLTIEQTSEALGIENRNHVIVTDKGMFVYSSGNVYMIDGVSVRSIGDAVKTMAVSGSALAIDQMENIYLGYASKRNALLIIGQRTDFDTVSILAVSLDTQKWAWYDINEVATAPYPLASYIDNDTTCVSAHSATDAWYKTYKLFGDSTRRTITAEWLLDFGDPDQDTIIYDISILSGAFAATATAKLDDTTFVARVKKRITRLTVTAMSSISSIRMLIRRFVVKTNA